MQEKLLLDKNPELNNLILLVTDTSTQFVNKNGKR